MQVVQDDQEKMRSSTATLPWHFAAAAEALRYGLPPMTPAACYAALLDYAALHISNPLAAPGAPGVWPGLASLLPPSSTYIDSLATAVVRPPSPEGDWDSMLDELAAEVIAELVETHELSCAETGPEVDISENGTEPGTAEPQPATDAPAHLHSVMASTAPAPAAAVNLPLLATLMAAPPLPAAAPTLKRSLDSDDSVHANGEMALLVPPVRTRTCSVRVSWSPHEDALVRRAVEDGGNKWARIAELLPGRTHAAVRNRWSRLQEEDLEREQKREQKVNLKAENQQSTSDEQVVDASSIDEGAGDSGDAQDKRLKWCDDEDALILESVETVGKRWRLIAERMPGRSEQAIRNRYYRLSAHAQTLQATSQGSWSTQEDALIMASVQEFGRKWTVVMQRLPNRTEDAIRNRYARLRKAQFARTVASPGFAPEVDADGPGLVISHKEHNRQMHAMMGNGMAVAIATTPLAASTFAVATLVASALAMYAAVVAVALSLPSLLVLQKCA